MITISNNEFNQLASFIKSNYGIHLKTEKQTLVISRLQNVLIQKGFTNFSEYYDYMIADKSGQAVSTLLDKITTNHTFFMREADHFDYFKDVVLPFFTNRITNRDLRIWCAGCSTGEEPYTLAMILSEYFGKEKLFWDTKVLATDISSKVLDEAKKGVYSNKEVETLPASWRRNYLINKDSEYSMFIDKIKNEVIYRKFNLMEEVFPFKKKFHVIFCRNVMIYFDEKTKNNLVNKFCDLLEPGGFLFIGHSEALNREATRLKYVMPAIYRKI
ncbi:MAG: CheR family methyltransferase [Mobilitalea sp.]